VGNFFGIGGFPCDQRFFLLSHYTTFLYRAGIATQELDELLVKMLVVLTN